MNPLTPRRPPFNICPQCASIGSSEEHSCPYEEDVNQAPDFTCTCCAACHLKCTDAI